EKLAVTRSSAAGVERCGACVRIFCLAWVPHAAPRWIYADRAALRVRNSRIDDRLLLPAMQSARGAGRRTQCADQLRQIGAAEPEYDGIHHTFANHVFPYDGSMAGQLNKQPTWPVALLPHLGENGLYQRWAVAMGFPPHPPAGNFQVVPADI